MSLPGSDRPRASSPTGRTADLRCSADNSTSSKASTASPLKVIVNYHAWLTLTENWIHTQVASLPADVKPYVVCSHTLDSERFASSDFSYRRAVALDDPDANLFAYADMRRAQRLRLFAAAVPKLGWNTGRKSALMAEVAARTGARVVHSHFGYTAYYSMRAVKKLGLRHVVTFYGVDMSALPASDARWIEHYQELFSNVDQVLCEGPHMAARVRDLGCAPEKIAVHHLGVNLGNLPFKPRVKREGEPLRVLISASFREKKGIPDAITALGRLGAEIPLEVTVIGEAGNNQKSQAERARIFAAVESSGLGSRIRFLGYTPHATLLAEAYRHHVFLSPSVTAADGDSEGGAPVSLIEMAATGMLIVSTRHADIPEVIVDQEGGLLAEERDPDGLLERLLWLFEHPELWFEMGLAARLRVEEEFDAMKQGVQLARVYQRLEEG